MIKNFFAEVCKNRNLMLILGVIIYILALYSALSDLTLFYAVILNILFIVAIIFDVCKPKYLLIFLLLFYFGIFNTYSRIKDSDELLNLAPLNSIISGQIVSIPKNKGKDKQSFYFKVNQLEYDDVVKTFNNEKVLVTLNTTEKYRIYDNYRIKGRLSLPFKAGNPSQFDYGNYLKNFGVYSVFYGDKSVKPVYIDSTLGHKEKYLQIVNDYREKIISGHSRYLTSPNLEILGGIVFGDNAISPPSNIKDSFINSGLLHILAASGMNVAFIFSFFFFIFSMLKMNYKLNISIGIVMVLIYSLMTGLGASVVRATFMLVFVLIGKLIDRDAHNVSLLAFVAFLMLVYNPMYINDVGFQLSFVVTLGLILMVPCIVKAKNKLKNWIIGTITIPIIAQLWVIPIQIFYFNNISLYSVFANIMSVPILSIISFGGFISSMLMFITPNCVCSSIDYILNPLITLLVKISDFWGSLPYSSVQTTHPSVLQLMIFYLILLILVMFLYQDLREKYYKFIKASFIFLMTILLFTFINFANDNLEILTFDVGNADAFLLKTPQNKYIMIDTGKSGYNGGKSQAKFLILKYLADRGIKTIDTIIITHFDNDHCGGAVDIMNGLKVKNIYVNSLSHQSINAQSIYKTAKEKGVNLILAKNNQVVYQDTKVSLTNFVISGSDEKHDNDASILTLVNYKKFKMLFTGDSGVNTFNKLKNYIPKDISVLKVGHHGANKVLDLQMVKYLNPEISIISVGNNKFGHPSLYTLAFLREYKILRTDINNSIKIVVNDSGYSVFVYDTKLKKYVLYGN